MKIRKLCAAITALLTSALIFLAPFLNFTGGAQAHADDGASGDYIYGDAEVTADVNEDKTVRVTEKFLVGFSADGVTKINRRIKHKYSSSRVVGGKLVRGRKFIAFVSEASAEIDGAPAEVTEYPEGEYWSIRISNADGSAFDREHGSVNDLYSVVLRYTYDLSDDGVKGIDDLIFLFFNEKSYRYYLNFELFSLTVNMPKPFEGSAVKVRREGGAEEWVPQAAEGEGLEITESSVKIFSNAGAVKYLTLQFVLPDGYFNASVSYFPFYWIFFGITCAAILFTLVIAFVFRKRRPLSPVELDPPEIDILHYSAYWHGRARRRDVCAVIFKWAQAGCVRIVKDGKKDIILEKIKELPESSSEAEKNYFAALFGRGKKFSSAEAGKIQNIAHAFRIGSAVSGLVNAAKEPEIFKPSVPKARFAVFAASVLAAVVTLVYFILIEPSSGLWILFGMVAATCLAFSVVVFSKWREIFGLKEGHPLVFQMLAYGVGCFALMFCIVYAALASGVYMVLYDYAGLLFINLAWIAVCAAVMPQIIGARTEEAERIYGRMLGFRRFILTAELSRMELLLEKNPSYFYEILPYCMIMGISGKLDKKLERMQVAAPDWAVGFDVAGIAKAMFASAKSALKTKKPAGKNLAGEEKGSDEEE